MKPPYIRIALLLSLVWIGKCQVAYSAPLDCGQTEQALHVRGVLTQTAPSRTNDVAPRVEREKFDLWFTGALWRARLEGQDGRIEEAGTDGRILYTVTTYPTNTRHENVSNRASASFFDGVTPVKSITDCWRIWLPFVSGCYLRELQDTNLPTFFNLFARKGITLPAIWRQEAQFPFSLTTLVYVNAGLAFGIGPDNRTHTTKLGPSYTNFTFTATAFTNVGSWRIPQTFTMEFFGIDRAGTTNWIVRKGYWVDGRVLDAELVDARMDFRPPIPDKTSFQDQRSEAERDYRRHGINVMISGAWPSIDSPGTRKVVDSPAPRQQPPAPPPPDRPKQLSWKMVVVVGAIFLVMVAVAIRAWRRDKAHLDSSNRRQ